MAAENIVFVSDDGLAVVVPPIDAVGAGATGFVFRDENRALMVNFHGPLPARSVLNTQRGPDFADSHGVLRGWFNLSRSGEVYVTVRSAYSQRRCWHRAGHIERPLEAILPKDLGEYGSALFRRPGPGEPGLASAVLEDIVTQSKIRGVASYDGVRGEWKHLSEEDFDGALSELHGSGRILWQLETIRPMNVD
ncbi:MAG: hypothetical protein AABY18_04695 [Candidatus Thermoplasmatota archaeon]